MPEGTSICLVTHDRPDTLRQTLTAIDQYARQPAEFIVVDNGSTDPATLALLKLYETTKGWRIVRNPTNLGLSKATNQGMALGQYDCLIHCDDDVLLTEPDWNQKLRDYFQYEKVGLAVPSQTWEYISHGGYKEIRWGLGMCFALRKSLFDDIGGYDEQLLHQTEVDLAIRVRMAGYHVAGVRDVHPVHNDPPGKRSALSLAREHVGCVQFRTKWAQWHNGRDWHYGKLPLFLTQHAPIDQDFYRRYGLANNVLLNPGPIGGVHGTEPGSRLGILDEDAARIPQKVQIAGHPFCVYATIRPDFSHFIPDDGSPDGAYDVDRQKAIDRWHELTGQRLDPEYVWHVNFLRPQDV